MIWRNSIIGNMELKYADTALLLFAKAPIPGEVNTRLIPDVGVEVATRLQAELIQSRLKSFSRSKLCDMQLWCSPDTNHALFKDCNEKFNISLNVQKGNDLGARMSDAINTTLKKYKHVVLIGTDAPALEVLQIEAAIKSLHCDNKIVLVPAEDGGYVLIGMSCHYHEVFLSVPWGTDRVLRKTRANVVALGLQLHELDTCWDIDRIEDYERYLNLKMHIDAELDVIN